jgi:hypothetical protein
MRAINLLYVVVAEFHGAKNSIANSIATFE